MQTPPGPGSHQTLRDCRIQKWLLEALSRGVRQDSQDLGDPMDSALFIGFVKLARSLCLFLAHPFKSVVALLQRMQSLIPLPSVPEPNVSLGTAGRNGSCFAFETQSGGYIPFCANPGKTSSALSPLPHHRARGGSRALAGQCLVLARGESPPLAGLYQCLRVWLWPFCLGLEGLTDVFGTLSVQYRVAEMGLAWGRFPLTSNWRAPLCQAGSRSFQPMSSL